jgi:hypothetical protein
MTRFRGFFNPATGETIGDTPFTEDSGDGRPYEVHWYSRIQGREDHKPSTKETEFSPL